MNSIIAAQLTHLEEQVPLLRHQVNTPVDLFALCVAQLKDIAEQMDREQKQIETYTEAHVAKLCGVTPKVMAQRREERRLPHFKVGRKAMYTRNHLLLVVKEFQFNVKEEKQYSRPTAAAA